LAFANVFRRRHKACPSSKCDMTNLGGMGPSHQFALWLILRMLQPSCVVESGVFNGRTTWLVRQALGDAARLILLSPDSQRNRYIDQGNAVYLTGKDFVDFANVDWKRLEIDQERTLVIFDDHMSAKRRLDEARRAGFTHVVWDDNFPLLPPQLATGDCLSPKMLCDGHERLPKLFGLPFAGDRDRFGTVKYQLNASDHLRLSHEWRRNTELYFELPPLTRSNWSQVHPKVLEAARISNQQDDCARLMRFTQRPYWPPAESAAVYAALEWPVFAHDSYMHIAYMQFEGRNSSMDKE